MSSKSVIERMAEIYLAGFDEDPLIDLKDIRQYSEPNFVGTNGKFHLVRCYRTSCDPGTGKYHGHGRENYIPNVANGQCAWCGWRGDPEIIAYIWCNMVLAGETDIHEARELLYVNVELRPALLPALGELTLEEIKEKYPAQYAMGKRRAENAKDYEVLDEDDGYPD